MTPTDITPIFTACQEATAFGIGLVMFAVMVADLRYSRFFRSIRNTPNPWKDLSKNLKFFLVALFAYMAVAADKTNLLSGFSGNGGWLSGSALESVEGGRYSLMEGGGSTEGASGITWAMLSGLPPFTSNAVLTANQFTGGFACVAVTNILPSALDAPSNAVVYTDWPYAVARQAVPLPQGCLPDGFTLGGRTVTNLYAAASGMLSFDGPKSSPLPATNGIPDGSAVNYISVLQTPSDIVPTFGLFWYAPGTNSSVFTWKDVFLGQDTNCLATVQAELYANGDFTCRYLFPSETNNYAQLTNAFLIGAQSNSGGETVLHTNALLAINDSFFPAFELQWKSLVGLDPAVPDRDSDGFSDADELFIYHTDPRRDDTDGDGIPDAAEIANGTDPLNPDENNDGIPDGVDLTGYSLSDTNLVFKLINNIAPGVDPLLDSDNDGWADWLELRFGTDPNYFSSTPDGLDTYFSVTVTLASPPTEPGVLAVGGSRVLVTGPGSWVFWRTPGEAHPVSFTSAHGVPPPFALSFNRPTAARYDMPVPDGKGGDFGKAALPLIFFNPAAAVCCHKTRTAEYCQTYTANVMPPMPGTYEWGTYAWAGGGGTWSTNAPNVVAVGHGVNWLRLRFTPCGASAYRDAWLWTDRHCSGPMIEPCNPGVVSVNNNDDDADETRDDTDTEITGGDPDLAELWPLNRSGSLCCQCPSHHPSATLASSSQKLALYMDSCKADSFNGTVHAGDAVYVEGLAPSTEPYAEKLVWQWTEDNETKSLTNALTVLSVRLFPDLDSDDDVDDSDVAGLASLSSEHGWLMPAATNVLRKLRLRTDVGLSGGAYTLTLSGDAGAFKVWADNSGTNAAPLLVCGQTVTNGVEGVTFLAGEDSDLYVEAASNATATITYAYAGTGDATNIACFAELKMTAFKVGLYIDSDNNNRYNPPDESETEEAMKMTAPGKIIIVNVDDDDSDGYPDNTDAEINGNADRDFDMSDLVIKCGLGTWDPAVYDLVLAASNYDLIRVFKEDGTLLLGPEMADPHTLQPSDLTAGRLNLVVEGVQTGTVTVALILKKATDETEVMRDEILITVDDHLGREPLGFAYISQHKDTALFCINCSHSSSDGHVWDADHGSYVESCWHCKMYCTRASVAMLNRYYRGSITQDEISYQFKGKWPKQPHNHLGHDVGLDYLEPLAWSLSLGVSSVEKIEHTTGQYDSDADWNFIADSIISYRPVIFIVDSPSSGVPHACSVSGVKKENDGTRWVYLSDPQAAGGASDWFKFSEQPVFRLARIANSSVPSIVARQVDIAVTPAGDIDGDGLMTFDEVEGRFSGPTYNFTFDPENWDSDNNTTNDLQDLKNFFPEPR